MLSSDTASINAGATTAPASDAPAAAPAAAPRRGLGGGRAWGALRTAHAANAIPGLDRSNAARSQKLSFAEVVWRVKWQEEQAKRRAERDVVQAAAIKSHGAFASIEYTPANNEVYRAALKAPSKANAYFPILVYIVVGACVGLLGTGMRLGIEALEAARFALIFDLCPEDDMPFNATTACTATLKPSLSLGAAACIFAGVACILIFVSASLVAFIAPAAAASGLPEVIAFLNGTFQAKIFAGRALLVKFTACLLAVGSGLPAGPEAPMIHLGAMVGRTVSAHDSGVAMLGKHIPIIDRLFRALRNEKDARDFVTAGTAAGVASAFGAPVGGVLFALEEISSSWTPSLTWKVFLTSMVAASVTCVIISAHSRAEEHLPFVGTIQRESIEFYQPETSENNVAVAIPAIVIGLVAGALAAGFTAVNLKLIALRKKYVMKAPWRRILEPIVVMLFVVGLTVGLSEAYDALGCTAVSKADPKMVDNLVGLHCPPGQYNEVATLLYSPGGKIIKLLWSRHSESGAGRDTFGVGALLLLLLVYVPLACWLAGSIVPTGLIVPVLLIGGAVGRVIGLLVALPLVQSPGADRDCDNFPGLEDCHTGLNWIDPGAFAIYGSAAFFGGISRLHLTVPVIFMEITGQTRLLLPIMLACKIGSVTADALHPHSLFHAIIEFKGLTFLAAEAPADRTHELDRQMIKQIITDKPPTLSSSNSTIGSALKVLESGLHNDVTYAVIDDKEQFEGTISLVQLLKLVDATLDGQELQHQPLEAAEAVQRSKTKEMCEADAEAVMARCRASGALTAPLALHPVLNTSSYTVNDKMSILRAYNLFRTMGCRHMVVVDISNKVVGMLTRHDLVDVCHPPHDDHGHHDPPAQPAQPAQPAGTAEGRDAPLLGRQ